MMLVRWWYRAAVLDICAYTLSNRKKSESQAATSSASTNDDRCVEKPRCEKSNDDDSLS